MEDRDLFLEYLESHPPVDKDSRRGSRVPAPETVEIDLHGYNVEEAETALLRKIAECSGRGTRILRVITGKGIHSGSGKAVLRDTVSDGLNHGKYGKIRSFHKAKAREGGSGVLVILL